MKLESKIQSEIISYLKGEGYVVIRNLEGNRGIPDLTAIDRDGSHTYIEVKNEAGRLSPSQKMYIESLRSHSCDVIVVRSVAELKVLL